MPKDSVFVSCVLATGDRPNFVRQAIRFFLRQTHRDAELIVVDGGRDPVDELCAGLLAVRYVRIAPDTSLGTRLNLGIELARGSIIQKIDDDDCYHPSFLSQAVAALERAPVDAVVAWDCFYVLFASERKIRFSGHGWAAGGTLCFRRDVWKRTPFRDRRSAVDYFFLQDARARPQRICAPELYVHVRHGGNTWTQHSGRQVEAVFTARADRTLADLVEPIDLAFYDALAEDGGG